jgi:hypothetical protein
MECKIFFFIFLRVFGNFVRCKIICKSSNCNFSKNVSIVSLFYQWKTKGTVAVDPIIPVLEAFIEEREISLSR